MVAILKPATAPFSLFQIVPVSLSTFDSVLPSSRVEFFLAVRLSLWNARRRSCCKFIGGCLRTERVRLLVFILNKARKGPIRTQCLFVSSHVLNFAQFSQLCLTPLSTAIISAWIQHTIFSYPAHAFLCSFGRSSSMGEKTDYSVKIQELQKQLTMDKEEAERLQLDSTVTLRRGEKKPCTNKVDVYSFGIVFWVLLTNRMPFSVSKNPLFGKSYRFTSI